MIIIQMDAKILEQSIGVKQIDSPFHILDSKARADGNIRATKCSDVDNYESADCSWTVPNVPNHSDSVNGQVATVIGGHIPCGIGLHIGWLDNFGYRGRPSQRTDHIFVVVCDCQFDSLASWGCGLSGSLDNVCGEFSNTPFLGWHLPWSDLTWRGRRHTRKAKPVRAHSRETCRAECSHRQGPGRSCMASAPTCSSVNIGRRTATGTRGLALNNSSTEWHGG
jgi:hypothetical protein